MKSSDKTSRRAIVKLLAAGMAIGPGIAAGLGPVGRIDKLIGDSASRVTGGISPQKIHTVTGEITPEKLGFTSMHEHVLFRDTSSPESTKGVYDEETEKEGAILLAPEPVPGEFFPEENNPITLKNIGYLKYFYPAAENAFSLTEDLMSEEIKSFVSLGGRSILDCSVPYERADPIAVKRLSESTGANIIMSTGLNSSVMIPKKFKKMSSRELADFFEQELCVGIDNTAIVAGNIKLLVDGDRVVGASQLTENGSFLKGLEAASKASSNIGAPVVIHAYMLSTEEFQRFFSKAKHFGMPLNKVILSHFDTMIRELRIKSLVSSPESFSLDLDLGRIAMDNGVTLSFDLLGAQWSDYTLGLAPQYDLYSLSAISQYVKEGYEDHIVVGTDTFNRLSTRRYGGHGMSHLLNYVVPTLVNAGVPESSVKKLTETNPVRLLAY